MAEAPTKPDPDPRAASASDDAIRALFQARVMEHARRPRNFGPLDGMTQCATGHNRLCGDHVTIMLRRDGDRIAAVNFEGAGCALSTASASLLTEAIADRTTASALAFQADVLAMLAGRAPADEATFGDVVVLSAVRAFPARMKCVTLAWETLAEALAASGSS